MTAEELLAAHPTIQEAIAWFEMIAGDQLWRLREAIAVNVTLPEIILWFQEVIDETLTEDEPQPKTRAKYLLARQQFDTPEFRVYLTGRLGLV